MKLQHLKLDAERPYSEPIRNTGILDYTPPTLYRLFDLKLDSKFGPIRFLVTLSQLNKEKVSCGPHHDSQKSIGRSYQLNTHALFILFNA